MLIKAADFDVLGFIFSATLGGAKVTPPPPQQESHNFQVEKLSQACSLFKFTASAPLDVVAVP